MSKPISLSGFSLSDLHAPGGVERLLDAHRGLFGDAVMEDSDGDNGQGHDGPQGTAGQGGGFTPPQSQDEFDRIIQDRVARERKKFADYDDLKARADRLTEIEDGQKSEVQRLNDTIEQLKTENDTLKSDISKKDRDALAAKIAHDKGVPVRYVTGDDEKSMKAAADLFLDDVKDISPQRRPGVVPTAGTGNQSKATSSMEAGRERALAQLEKHK